MALSVLAAVVLAAAPPAAVSAPPAPPPVAPIASTAEDRAAAAAMARRLTEFNDRIATDEARLTVLRDAALAQSNAITRTIMPVMPLRGAIVR